LLLNENYANGGKVLPYSNVAVWEEELLIGKMKLSMRVFPIINHDLSISGGS
jgi:hypothetical protein